MCAGLYGHPVYLYLLNYNESISNTMFDEGLLICCLSFRF